MLDDNTTDNYNLVRIIRQIPGITKNAALEDKI